MSQQLLTAVKFNPTMDSDTFGLELDLNPKAGLLGLVELLKRQTMDERTEEGTFWQNQVGFSKKHVTDGTALATVYLQVFNTDDLEKYFTVDQLVIATNIAQKYRLQLFTVCAHAFLTSKK